MIRKLQLSLFFLMVLLLASTAYAGLDDLNPSFQEDDTQDTIVWPMLPNESLADLATKFYPKNGAMQSKFIRQTQKLNGQAALDPNERNAAITTIVIPNLHSLSVTAGPIKGSPKKSSNKPLRLSYKVESALEKAKSTFQNIPDRLIQEYERLVVRNTFLKEELAKLNQRLIFLQNKLGDLKLILDKTLTFPTKKTFKNLDVEKEKTEQKQSKPISKPPVAVATNTKPAAQASFFDFSNKLLWLGILAFGLLIILGSFLYKKFQEKKYLRLVNLISQQEQVTSFGLETKVGLKGTKTPATTLSADTIVEEHNGLSILREAKVLVAENSLDEAIAHLKWAIKAEPKTAINVWLYLLDLFRQQDSKDEFEKFALKMHQNFNVMTPLWEERKVAIVVPQSLEDFPYIIKLLTDKWPNEKIARYLQKLISDNRGGERSGFSQPVIEEVLLLIDVLEVRNKE
jgi:hypothetical protein